MTPVYQSQRGELGSCLRACLASVLDLPELAVPHFIEPRFHTAQLPDFVDARFEFDGSWFSFVVMWAWMMGFEIVSAARPEALGSEYAIAFGPSGEGAGDYHAVVYGRRPDGGYLLVHDPVREGTPGLASEPNYWMALRPLG